MDSLASVEIRRLQEQNSALRAVVTQMRKDMEGLGHLLVLPNAEAPVQPPYQESSASKGNTAGAVWLCIQTLMSFCITVTNYTRKPFQWAPHAKIDLTQWPTSLLLILLLNMLLLNLQPQTLCSSHVRKKSLELSWTCFLFFILMYKIIALDNLTVKLNFNTPSPSL